MYVINVKSHYDSAHFLRNYHGKCERLHGHRYVAEAGFAFDDLGDGGMAHDFSDAKRHLRAVTDGLDHQNLNDLPEFESRETSAENQARFIFDRLKSIAGTLGEHLLYVRVWETPNQWAQYSERPMAW